jgi:hypothetical protein
MKYIYTVSVIWDKKFSNERKANKQNKISSNLTTSVVKKNSLASEKDE